MTFSKTGSRRRAGIRLMPILLGVALFATACGDDGGGGGGGASAPEDAASQGTVDSLGSITVIGQPGATLSLIEQLAVERGFLEAHGLDSKFVGGKSAPELISAMLGGSAQFATTAISVSAPLIQQGECITFLTAGMGGLYNFIAQPDLDLPNADKPYPENLQDLKGKTIGIIARGSAMEIWANAVLAEAGIKPDEVTYIGTGGGATAATAIREKQVDVQMSFPPLEQLLKPEEFQMLADLGAEEGDVLDELLQAGMATPCDYAEENPEIVTAYCRGIWDAYDYALDPANTKDMAAFLAEMSGLEPAVAEDIWDAHLAAGVYEGPELTEARWQSQDAFLPEGTPLPSYDKHVDQSCAMDDPRES